MIKKNRLAAALAVLFLTASVTAPAAFAAESDFTYTLAVNGGASASVKVGDTVKVTLTLSENSGEDWTLYSAQDYVCFDPEYFSVDESSIAASNGFSASALTHGGQKDRVFVNRAEGGGADMPASAQILSFSLKALKTTSGSSAITHRGVEITRKDVTVKYETSVKEASVTVTSGSTSGSSGGDTSGGSTSGGSTAGSSGGGTGTSSGSTSGSSGGGGGGGGGSSSSSSGSKDTDADEPDTVITDPETPAAAAPEIKAPAASDETGSVKADVTADEIDAALDEAKGSGADTIVIVPETDTDGASRITVEIPKDAADSAAGASVGITVKTDIASVTIPSAALADLAGKSVGSLTVTAESVGSAVHIEIAADGAPTASLDGGVAVSLPFTPATGNVLVVIGSDGTESIVQKSIVDGSYISAIVDGSCTVKVIDNSKSFSDIAGHWAADNIAFVSSHEIFNGVSENEFAPDTPMNRGMLATALYRLEGSLAVPGQQVGFADVESGAWYEDAVAWASANGIVTGYGDGSFGPLNVITREQLATMIYRYAGSIGMDTVAAGSLEQFTDGGDVSDWAVDAMRWATGNGLVNGKAADGGAALDPAGQATRAEVAAISERLIKLMLS